MGTLCHVGRRRTSSPLARRGIFTTRAKNDGRGGTGVNMSWQASASLRARRSADLAFQLAFMVFSSLAGSATAVVVVVQSWQESNRDTSVRLRIRVADKFPVVRGGALRSLRGDCLSRALERRRCVVLPTTHRVQRKDERRSRAPARFPIPGPRQRTSREGQRREMIGGACRPVRATSRAPGPHLRGRGAKPVPGGGASAGVQVG